MTKSININNHTATIETGDSSEFLVIGDKGAIKIGNGVNLPEVSTTENHLLIDYKGVIRYNNDLNALEYCDGTQWRTITETTDEGVSAKTWSLLF